MMNRRTHSAKPFPFNYLGNAVALVSVANFMIFRKTGQMSDTNHHKHIERLEVYLTSERHFI